MPTALFGSTYYSDATITNYTVNNGNEATNLIDGDLGSNLGGEGTLASGSNVDYDPNPIIAITNTNPVDASGISIFNDKGLAGDGAEDVIVRMFDQSGTLIGTELLTIPTSKFEGDLTFTSGTTYQNIASWEIEVDNNHSGNGATAATLQIRELGLFGDLSPPIVCFTTGMAIETNRGEVNVEDLAIGDLVRTLDNGYQPIRYIYRRKVPASGAHRPVVFEKGAIGNDRPLVVSQLHRIYTHHLKNRRAFAQADNHLIQAKQLVNGSTIRLDTRSDCVEYFHIMFDKHELIHCHGVVSESWQPHCRNLKRDENLRRELESLFPEIRLNNGQSPERGAPVRQEVTFTQ